MKKRILLSAALFILIAVAVALAHAVSLWAYVENGRVYVEAFFSDGTKVKNGSIYVLDAKEKKLLEGKTDDQGKFDFEPPVKDDMIILLKLGEGHNAEFKIKAEDFKKKDDSDKTPSKTK